MHLKWSGTHKTEKLGRAKRSWMSVPLSRGRILIPPLVSETSLNAAGEIADQRL
jgi:hypothetical protein